MVDAALIERKAYELIGASIAGYMFFEEMLYGDSPVRLPFIAESRSGSAYRFKVTVRIPSDGYTWLFKVHGNVSGLLRVNGSPYYGIDSHHTFCKLPRGVLELSLELIPTTAFGSPAPRLFLDYALLAKVYWRGFSLGLNLLALYDYIANLDDPSLRWELVESIGGILASYRIQASVPQLVVGYMILHDHNAGPWRADLPRPRFDLAILASQYRGRIGKVWEGGEGSVAELSRLVDVVEARLLEALREVKARRGDTVGDLTLIGHSHLDVAWLWTRVEGKLKALKTASIIAYITEEYGALTGLSSAQIFSWVEEERELFEKLRGAVERGLLEPLGGIWVEGDLNIVDGESLARQLLYGQTYFRSRFSRSSKVAWLPDNFGYSANLPQLLLEAGLRMLVIQKLHWNDTNKPRGHFFKWRGLDGSVIPVMLIPQYDSPGTPRWVYRYARTYDAWSVFPHLLVVYGFGDGGGGPSIEAMESQRLLESLPGIPRVSRMSLEELIDKALSTEAPVVEGELYLELHRGAYTTNARVKELIAKAESSLRSAEIASVLGELLKLGEARSLEALWRRLLFNQFHDIAAGTAVEDEYRIVVKDLEGVVSEAQSVISKAVGGIGGGLVVFNDMPWPRGGVIEVVGEPGYRLPCHRVGGKTYIYIGEVPPLGFKVYSERGECVEPETGVYIVEGEGVKLGNGLVEVEVGSSGELLSLRDSTGFNYLGGPSGLLRAHVDQPSRWDAWDVEREALENWEPVEPLGGPRITLRGPLVACSETPYRWGSSSLVERVCVKAGSPLVELHYSIDWRDRGSLLKAWFTPTLKPSKLAFEAPFGVVYRSIEELSTAKFEAPALRWVDVSDGDRGLAFISISRHGYSYIRGSLGVSLVKKPTFPNPATDEGVVEALIALYPHKGDYVEGEVHKQALNLWSPLKAFESREESRYRELSLLKVEPSHIILSALKKAEDGKAYILRLYNTANKEAEAVIELNPLLATKIKKVIRTNILEDEVGEELELDNNKVKLSIKPYKVVTLRLQTI